MNSTKSREPTLTLVNYWLALPRTADGPLVHVRDFLEETADDDDEIAVIETRARRLLCSVRVRPAARRGGAAVVRRQGCAWPKGAWVRVRARVCATWALPAPLRPPTRRENQGPFGPKWRSGALSGVAVR